MNTNAFLKTCCSLALIPLLLTGCANQPMQPPPANSIASKVIYLNELSDIVINDLRMIPVNDFLVVEAEIINTDDSQNALEYRFQWRDRNGMDVGVEENWKPLTFAPSQAQRIKGIATSKKAADFKLELKNNY